MAVAGSVDSVSLGNGETMQLARVPDVDDATWNEMKAFLEGNPDTARKLQSFSRNPEAVRGFMQTQAIASHYAKKIEGSDAAVEGKIKALESDPELKAMFEEVKAGGLEAAMKFWEDEEMMLRISQKMGGLPQEVAPALKKIDETPLSLHEAAKQGDLASVGEYLKRGQPIDAQDLSGITPLGYAIGMNRIAVVKSLLDGRANPHSVDATGNSGLHYASGYGRKELCEYLLRINANPNQVNAQGQTPMTVATTNKQAAIVAVLSSAGGRA